MFAVGIIKICWASSLDKINNFFNQNHIAQNKSFRITFQTLQIIVTLNHPYFHWSLSCHHMIRIMFQQINSLTAVAAAALCIHTHVKYDESIKMLNVTDSWEFGFYSPKGYILNLNKWHGGGREKSWKMNFLRRLLILILFFEGGWW